MDHACSFAGVHNRSLGEDLENIIYLLAPNNDFGYMVPITILPLHWGLVGRSVNFVLHA